MGIQYGSTAIRDVKYCNAQGVLQDVDSVVRNGSSIWTKPPPELPAEVLQDSCYSRMFQDCISLVKSPILKAVNQVRDCYYAMFSGCDSLSEVTTKQTSFAGSESWLPSNTGVFHCTQTLKNVLDRTSSRSSSNVPSTWSIAVDQD